MNSLQRQTNREKSHSREINSLNNKYLERQPLRDPPQDRNDDERSGNCDCDERLKDPEFTYYFYGQANLNTSKVAGHYYNTHAKVTFENSPSNQALDETRMLIQESEIAHRYHL